MNELETPRKIIYAFALGNTHKILYQLKKIDNYYLAFPNNLERYLDRLIQEQPSRILGLGSYSGVDQDKIRIETICSNKFRNNLIEGNKYQEIKIKPLIEPTELMKVAKAIGNSYCNLISWKIMHLINQHELQSSYTFLHIPKTMKQRTAIDEINRVLW